MEEMMKIKAQPAPLLTSVSDAEIAAMDRYWRAANYLSVGQIYLLNNPLLKESLTLEHVKPRLLGHWGTTPGLNLSDDTAKSCLRSMTGSGHTASDREVVSVNGMAVFRGSTGASRLDS